MSARNRSAFLAGRVQRLDAFVIWSRDPGLRPVGAGAPGRDRCRGSGGLAERGRKTAATYLASEIEAAADRFLAMIDAGRSLVAEHTPVEMLGARRRIRGFSPI